MPGVLRDRTRPEHLRQSTGRGVPDRRGGRPEKDFGSIALGRAHGSALRNLQRSPVDDECCGRGSGLRGTDVKATVFLGGGRITSALIAGLRLAGYDRALVVQDRNPGKLRDLKRRYGVEVQANLEKAVAHANRLIVAVRPDSV